jgi:hypothetical protein
MKLKEILTVLISFITLLCSAQTVYLYTPVGSQVHAYQRLEELSAIDIANYANMCQNSFSEATVLANASTTYNCHSCAWNMREGGSTCWLDQTPDLKLI